MKAAGGRMNLYIIPIRTNSTVADVDRYRRHHDVGPHPDIRPLDGRTVAERIAEFERQIRLFEEMFGLLVASGFRVERIVEPFPHHPEDIARGDAVAPYTSSFWEGQYERLSRVPFSIVYVARKP